MKHAELRACLEKLAHELDLRWTEKSRCFVGIYRGIIVQMSEWNGNVTMMFHSPTADIGDQVLEDFKGFTHFSVAGLPLDAIGPLMIKARAIQAQASHKGCCVRIDSKRIDQIGVEEFERVPDAVAEDLHAFGATKTLPCANCATKTASQVGLLDYAAVAYCDDCWDNLKFETSSGKLAKNQSVNWLRVLPALTAATVAGAFVWGGLQQPQWSGFGHLLFLFPLAWAFLLSWMLCKYGGGVTPALRWALIGSVLASVTAGNVWGYRSWVIKAAEERLHRPVVGPGWAKSIHMYFQNLPDNLSTESTYFLLGLAGAWLGQRRLKAEEKIDVQ